MSEAMHELLSYVPALRECVQQGWNDLDVKDCQILADNIEAVAAQLANAGSDRKTHDH